MRGFLRPVIDNPDFSGGDPAFDQEIPESGREHCDDGCPAVGEAACIFDRAQGSRIREHPCRRDGVRPHVLNIEDEWDAFDAADDRRCESGRQRRVVGVDDVGLSRHHAPENGCGREEREIVRGPAESRLVVTRIEGNPQNRNAVHDLALPPTDPVSRIDMTAGIVRKPRDDLDVVSAAKKLAREREPFEIGLRGEPLRDQEDFH